MRKHKEDPKRAPFVACGAPDCYNGLVRVKLGTGFVMRDCSCMLAWKALNSGGHVSMPPPPAVQFWWQDA